MQIIPHAPRFEIFENLEKNKTENAFSPTLPEMLFDRKKSHKMLQNISTKC